jgi:hypothetical protein
MQCAGWQQGLLSHHVQIFKGVWEGHGYI